MSHSLVIISRTPAKTTPVFRKNRNLRQAQRNFFVPLEAFSNWTGEISLYSADLILHRMNDLFAVFSWIQILIGILFSGTILFSIRPLLADNPSDHTPDLIGDATNAGSTVASVGTKGESYDS